MGALALNGPQGWRVGRGGQAQQCSDVVGEYLGGHVDEQGVLAQARDGFEVHAAFEALEGLFDAPALVVQRAEIGGRCGAVIEVGHQHTQRAGATTVAIRSSELIQFLL